MTKGLGHLGDVKHIEPPIYMTVALMGARDKIEEDKDMPTISHLTHVTWSHSQQAAALRTGAGGT